MNSHTILSQGPKTNKTLILKDKTINKIKRLASSLEQYLDPDTKYIVLSDQYIGILPHLKQWKINQLTMVFYKNQHSKIMMHITSINLSSLSILFLQNMKISSFQPLQFMECLNLNQLFLTGNECPRLKSLAKTKFSKLIHIDIDFQINLSENSNLSRMDFSTEAIIKIENINEEQQLEIKNGGDLTQKSKSWIKKTKASQFRKNK